MPVNYSTPSPAALFPVAGVRLGVAEAAIRKPGRLDLTVLELSAGTRVAGVFTANRFLRRARTGLPPPPGTRQRHPRPGHQYRCGECRHG
jgi:hypothetical protein